MNIQSMLFDLDGTLVDTAPDMIAALNVLRAQEGLSALDQSVLRCQVSNGSAGLIDHGMPQTDAQQRQKWIKQFLDLYEQKVYENSALFDGMGAVLQRLEQLNLPWGIVTNKPTFLSVPLLTQMGLIERLSTLVCGDTLEKRKPHPEPLLFACHQVGADPEKTVYVGDALRDIQSGQAAGCLTSVALYGYIESQDAPQQWQANQLIQKPNELIQWLDGSRNLD